MAKQVPLVRSCPDFVWKCDEGPESQMRQTRRRSWKPLAASFNSADGSADSQRQLATSDKRSRLTQPRMEILALGVCRVCRSQFQVPAAQKPASDPLFSFFHTKQSRSFFGSAAVNYANKGQCEVPATFSHRGLDRLNMTLEASILVIHYQSIRLHQFPMTGRSPNFGSHCISL